MEYLMRTMKLVPAEERTTEFREKLFNEAIWNDKHGRDTCIGKSIRKRHALESRISLETVPSAGTSVYLYCMGILKATVDKGVLVSKDPEETVDNMPLGRDDWKVFVADVIYPNYEFRRLGFKKELKLGQMIGKSVACPKSNVRYT
ncbi:hypothetical protein LIER_12764 [Lithospermum erythrorhizon]|uniref:Uncharacterized protein n=1 Tax=Lithospermum erythrorhizon TaxID=34254 RepID=A0AAV3PUI9_LITER